MQRFRHFLLLTLIISTCAFAECQNTLPNLSLVKEDLQKYHDSGTYQAEISHTINQAMVYLRFRVHQNNRLAQPKKLAIVLDIDETSLSNYSDMLRLNFGGSPDEVDMAEGSGHDPAISETLKLYNYAKSKGVAVFFVTGRHPTIKQNTVANLLTVGFKNWDGLYLKPLDYHEKSVVDFKSNSRHDIIAKGYDIILNIGDQESDLKGGYSDMVFKLPNPYYFIR